MPRNDVIIIGCGPAGLASAISCANNGMKVTILESNSKLTSRPGESLLPGIEPILKQLGILKEFLRSDIIRHNGKWIQWDGELHFAPFGNDENSVPWVGFQAPRPAFDHLLLDKALDIGVDIVWSSKIKKTVHECKKIVGIETRDEAFHSSYLIDATGNNHWLSRHIGLNIENYSPSLIAYFGYAKGNCDTCNNLPCLIAEKHGWIWTAQINHQFYQWVRLFFDKKLVDYDWLPKQFSNLQKKGSIRGSNVTWRCTSSPSGLGYFVVGDAAATLDPASSHGVLRAIMSGMMAAHMISKINRDSSVEEQAITEYSRWIKEWFLHDVKKLKELYRKHPNPPEWVLENSTIASTN